MENNDVRFRKIDERIDRTASLVDALHEEMIALDGKISALVEAQARTEAAISALADGHARTEAALSDKISALVDAQIRTEAHVARLENAFVTFAELAQSMDERMDISDRRADALHEEMAALTAKMAALVDAQILTEVKFVESRQAQTRTDDRLNALISIVDRHVRGNGHEHSS